MVSMITAHLGDGVIGGLVMGGIIITAHGTTTAITITLLGIIMDIDGAIVMVTLTTIITTIDIIAIYIVLIEETYTIEALLHLIPQELDLEVISTRLLPDIEQTVLDLTTLIDLTQQPEGLLE